MLRRAIRWLADLWRLSGELWTRLLDTQTWLVEPLKYKAETEAELSRLRLLHSACERLIIASKRGGQRVPQAEWYAMVEAYEKASAAYGR